MSRKTQFGWLSVAVLLCLFSAVLTVKMRDGNKAVACQDDKRAESLPSEVPPPPLPPTPSSAEPLPAESKPPQAILQTPEMPQPEIIRTGATSSEPPTIVEPSDSPPFTTPAPAVQPSFAQPATMPPQFLPPAGKPLPPIMLDKFKEETPAQATPKSPTPPLDERPIYPSPSKPTALPAPLPEESSGGVQPVSGQMKQEPGEPPMVVPAGPAQIYQVRGKTETLPDIARRTLGATDRASEIVRLNPDLKPDAVLVFGTNVRLPADACILEEADAIKPLPSLRPQTPPAKAKILPLTGTFPCNLDAKNCLTLPKAIRDQLGNCETVLVSPGSDHCLWLTNHAHLERLAERIEQSPAREADVRVFKRLYYAQTEIASVTAEGRVTISAKLAQFAGLGQELVIVGIDEHFELWDAARWKQYTQQKSGHE